MSKIYVVTSGEYSDFCIEKICATLEAAEKYCATRRRSYGDPPEIQVWDVYDGSDIECEQIYKAIKCSISDKDSRIISCHELYGTSPYKLSVTKSEWTSYTNYIIPINRDVSNADHIRKIIYDTVAQYKAGTMGL